MNTTDELATLISKGDVAFLQTSDLGLLIQSLSRVRVGQKVPPCVWGECEFHVNWLHVSQIRPTQWRLNDDFGVNQRRRRLTRNIRIGVCVCMCDVSPFHKISFCNANTCIKSAQCIVYHDDGGLYRDDWDTSSANF